MYDKHNTEPTVRVGILCAPTVEVIFHGNFMHNGNIVSGRHKISVPSPDAPFVPIDKSCTFEIENVTIGINFHWERKESQRFKGALQIIEAEQENYLWAVNIVAVEDYLSSVISSEMSAAASLELLKAHAVISRSWLLAQISKKHTKESAQFIETDSERIRWYDRDDHPLFDVCADDHCQRYQGISRQTTPTVAEAVAATRGIALTDEDGNLCDARFSKSCGGVFEQFENCWEPIHHSYLEALRDNPDQTDFPDLSIEENAHRWIATRPDAFCNTTDAEVLAQVLNDYDRETRDFYRWTVRYSRNELSALVKERSGIDFGEIVDMEPLQRGTSGRLIKLKIIGTKRSMTIGKELEIRRTLSTSHLYSSAFVVDKDADGFTLRGAGWGHGVGLCQIGAAVMGAKGYSYNAILAHYYPGSKLTHLYD